MEWFKLINATSLDAILKPDGRITNNVIFGKNLINGISMCFITLSRFPDILIEIDKFVGHLNTFTRNILFHEFDPIHEKMSTSIMRFANSFTIARDDLHQGIEPHLVANKLGRILDTWNRDLGSYSSSLIEWRHRENNTTIFNILERSRTGAKSSLIHFSRTLINSLIANPGYKKCFAQALIGILPNENADRMESFLRKYIAQLGFNQDELKMSIGIAYELGEKFGINLLQDNPCLLTLIPPPYIPPWKLNPRLSSGINPFVLGLNPFNYRPSWMQTAPPLCEKKIQVLIRGDIFTLSLRVPSFI
jgi:hypothetical protein